MTLLLHVACAVLATYGLWRLWRVIATGDRRVAQIVGIGLLIRIVGAQALFWISWLQLPFGRSLQLGDGYWFYAVDAPKYVAAAHELASRGFLASIAGGGVQYPSEVFVQLLSLCVFFFGFVGVFATFLNGFTFLVACLVIVRLAPTNGTGRTASLVALAAIAFGPGSVLWALQPLKDTVFTACILLMVGAFRLWETAARQVDWLVARRWLLLSAAGMAGTTYAIAGIRWYVAAILWWASSVLFIWTALTARRRWIVGTAALVVFVVLAQALRFGAKTELPTWIARQLDPRTFFTSVQPAQAITSVGDARRGFDEATGATTIVASKRPGAQPSGGSGLPARVSRLAVGLVALAVPPTLARAVGVYDVQGGGHGLWLFVDIDTIGFDAVLVFAVISCARQLRRRKPTALFVTCTIALFAIAIPMAYAVTNLGTLFRLRQMVYVFVAILPLTLEPASKPSSDDVSATGARVRRTSV